MYKIHLFARVFNLISLPKDNFYLKYNKTLEIQGRNNKNGAP